MGRADIFLAVTQLGRGVHSLQPDPLVTHFFIVSRVVLAAWQLWGKGIKTLFRVKTTCPTPSWSATAHPVPRGAPESRDPLQ